MFDRSYDEFEVGMRCSYPGFEITEAHVNGFADLVGDHHPLHVDADFAARSPYGQRIAHGFLVLSSSSGMFPMDPEFARAFYGMDDVRFLAPTFLGDELRLEQEVIAKRNKGDGGVVSVRQALINQRDETVCVATLHVLVARRAEAATA